jgi:hypothetical protein
MKMSFLAAISFVILASIGYGLNIMKLATECDFQGPYKAEMIRGIGIVVPPSGAIMGYLEIEDN